MSKKKGNSTSTTLEAHSQAKVELFKKYLATYLNILLRAKHIDHLQFFDLCAGEGVYADGGKGSPVVIMETIRRKQTPITMPMERKRPLIQIRIPLPVLPSIPQI